MYANLNVRVIDQQGVETAHVAHLVQVVPTGVVIHLDDPEDEGSYPVPVGEVKVAGARLIAITADF
jgi:hypothetical protein